MLCCLDSGCMVFGVSMVYPILCRAVENTVLQNRRGNVQLIADAVGISTGSVKTCANTC